VDAQVAPRPRLPGNAGGAGGVRVVELGTMLGSFGYELRCDPAGGTVPHPARICAVIVRHPALLYSFPGPGHSCPPGGPTVSIAGNWNGKPLHSTFSVCTGGQEQQAGAWGGLLPSAARSARPAHAGAVRAASARASRSATAAVRRSRPAGR